MRIVSWNVNGVRAAMRHGLQSAIDRLDADVICWQETKADDDFLPRPPGYGIFSRCARKSGYSGVATLVRGAAEVVEIDFGLPRFHQEGRAVAVSYHGLLLVNLYLPHGGREQANMGYKLEVFQRVGALARELGRRDAILLGDFNVAHTELDLARPKQNARNTMFTPGERAAFQSCLDAGWVDCFRVQNPSTAGKYTWWPYSFDARSRNVGWRIDYILLSRSLAQAKYNSIIWKDVLGSDHCPVSVDIYA